MDKLQSAEKPFTFIFTYLERHWIDRQINEPRIDILPIKQLLWSMWDEIVLKRFWMSDKISKEIADKLRLVRGHQFALEELDGVAKFVHYLRVISKPTHLESDYKATRRVMMAGAVINRRAVHADRFKEFVEWYCETIEIDCPNLISADKINEFVHAALQFWYEEEGRMSFLRFDKSAQITVRNHLKSLLLLPNLELLRDSFKQSILNWNIMDANSIYRLLANRKSLLIQLDSEAESAFLQRGINLLKLEFVSLNSFEDIERSFISLLGQYYNDTSDLIQTSFASRSELYDSRTRAFRSLFNDPPLPSNVSKLMERKASFSAKSLAKFTDFLVRNCPENLINNNLSTLVSLFRLIDNKDEFQEMYAKLLSLRLLCLDHHPPKKPSLFEKGLLRELESICGYFYIKPFEKMHGDICDDSVVPGLTILTGGTWNLNCKILPGNSILLNPADKFDWPCCLKGEIEKLGHWYTKRHPRRKLYFSPLLTCIEFEYSLGDGRVLDIKASALHLSILKDISDNSSMSLINSDCITSKYGLNSLIVLKTLLNCNLIVIDKNSHCIHINNGNDILVDDFGRIDLYSSTLNELIYDAQELKIKSSFMTNSSSSRSTPHTNFTPSGPSIPTITSLDKSILLQCSITRLMKQLRSLNLPDLFTRISMLPKLLMRFSPSMEDILEALKQLHEKEFVMLAIGDGIDEIVEIGEDELKKNEFDRNNIWIKYLA